MSNLLSQETEKYIHHCESEFKKAQSISSMQMKDWHDVPWTDFFADQSPKKKIPTTGIDKEVIRTICAAVSDIPAGIEAHSQASAALNGLSYHGR